MLRFLVIFLLIPSLAVAGQALTQGGIPAPTAQQTSPIEEARRLFEQLKYEEALPFLAQILVDLQTRPALDAEGKALRASALELRARARFGLGDRTGSRDDLRDLLLDRPAFVFGAGVSPRLTAVLEEVRKATVGSVTLTPDPPDAAVEIDGIPVTVLPGVALPLAAGPHRFVARKPGYKPFELDFVVPPGVTTPVALTPERVSAVIVVFTSPPGVSVTLDGRMVGETQPGPPPAAYAAWLASKGYDPTRVSAPLEVADVTTGVHEVGYALPCHIAQDYRVEVPRPDDFRLEPAVMKPSVGTIRVPPAGAGGGTVFLDGQAKGAPPLVFSDVCSGPHTVEVRSPVGRLRTRLELAAGADVTVEGQMRPAIALVSTSGPRTNLSAADVLMAVERLYADSRASTVFVPPAEALNRVLAEQRIAEGWLQRSALQDLAAAQGPDALAESATRDAGRRLAQALDAQAVADVVFAPREGGTVVMLRVLAAGGGRPDDVEVFLDSPTRSVAALDGAGVRLTKPALAFDVLDIVDVDGVVVLGAEGTGAPVGGVSAGDVLAAVNGKKVTSGAVLERILADTKPGDRVQLTMRDRAGAARQVEQTVQARPRLVAVHDRGVVWNKAVLDLRARLAAEKDPLELAVAQANLAVSLMRLGNWSDARELLGTAKLTADAGVGRGTLLYLQGLCSEALSDTTAAVTAYKAAAAVPGALLTEDGPPIGPLAAEAEARLGAGLRRDVPDSFMSSSGA